MVREYKGSHSGEHGDGIVRSEFNEPMFGARLARAFEQVKDRFDPNGLSIPARSCARRSSTTARCCAIRPAIAARISRRELDWSAYHRRGRRFPGRGRDVQQQRRLPQARRRRHVPELPRHARRARRHARARQYAAACHHRPAWAGCADLRRNGRDAEALRLLQGLPPRMPDRRRHGAHEDRGAGGARGQARALAARPAGRLSAALCALCGEAAVAVERARRMPGMARLSERVAGFSAQTQPAEMARAIYIATAPTGRRRLPATGRAAREVVLFADTFNRYFERENLDAALSVLVAAGYRVHAAAAGGRRRAPALLRTHVPVGRPGRRGAGARWNARWPRSHRFIARGVPVIGLEPSCLLTFRDELPALIKTDGGRHSPANALLFEEFLAREQAAGRLRSAARAAREARAAARPLPPEGVRCHGRGRERAAA